MVGKGNYIFYILPVTAVMIIFLLLPLTSLFTFSLKSPNDGHTTLTINNYLEILGNSYYLKSIINSILLCIPTSIVAVFASMVSAWYIAERGKGAGFLKTTFTFSYAFGGIIYGMIFVMIFGNAGIVALGINAITHSYGSYGIAYTSFGLALAYLLFQVPRSALFMASAFEQVDRDILSSSRTLGASRLQSFTRVLIPLCRKQIVNTLILIFSMSMSSFGVALLIAQNYHIFTVAIYKTFNGSYDSYILSTMGIILFMTVLIINMGIRIIGGYGNEVQN